MVNRAAGGSRAQAIDSHVGQRIRTRRAMLGLTQQQLADLIGVTYQQAHKYEKGTNRVAAGRLYMLAQSLGVHVDYFFEGFSGRRPSVITPNQRMVLELSRNFMAIPNRRHREALCSMARTLAEGNDLA